MIAVSVALYGAENGGWLHLVLLFLLPDLSMIGYVPSPRIGALSYNLIHTYIGPLISEHMRLAAGTAWRNSLLSSGWHTSALISMFGVWFEISDPLQGHAFESGPACALGGELTIRARSWNAF